MPSFSSLRAATCAAIVALLSPCLSAAAAAGQNSLVYRLRYDLASPNVVHVSIAVPAPQNAPLTLIMPRTTPGGYEQQPYDPYVTNVKAYADASNELEVHREEFAPRWKLGKSGDRIKHIDYDIDVVRMEREILSSGDSSKIREGYVGLLGYSIFAFLDGGEHRPIRLEVSAPANWPVFSTLAPRVPPQATTLNTQADDYYALADSQIAMGPKLQLRQIDVAVPLFLSVYAESEEDLAQEGALAREALDKVIAYFGEAPFTTYTVYLELVRPLSDKHDYGFSMEHLNSGTFFFDTSKALTSTSSAADREAHRFNYAHHIAHSWIPKRAYSDCYLPFTWEMAPVSDTIWFNEGFGRYVAIEALSDALPAAEARRYRQDKLDRLRSIVSNAPAFIARMSLPELSREGSFLYADDFRIGQNLFSRGALMAAEMDDHIRQQTSGQKSLRDALRHLMDWSEKNRRALRVEELPGIFREATGVDTSSILNRWLQPPAR